MTAHKGLRTKLDKVTISTLPNKVYYPYQAAITIRRDIAIYLHVAPSAYFDLPLWRRQALKYIMAANITKRQLRGGR
jgi:hypothetical protein